MGGRLISRVMVALVIAILTTFVAACNQAGPGGSGEAGTAEWVGTWAASPSPPLAIFEPQSFENVTLRQIVHTSVGGDQLRVRISNTFGMADLLIGGARVALDAGGAMIDSGTDTPLTFSGQAAIEVPAGATAVSDPVSLTVPPFSNLAVSIYFPEDTGPATSHAIGLQTSYVSEPGNHLTAETLPVAEEIQSWQFLSGVEVLAPAGTKVIVAFGDSITDGAGSTPDTNRRWPNYLARRLAERSDRPLVAVLNQGISGNRVLHDVVGQNALARFDRDVLAWPGVSHVIVLEGINDIRFSGSEGLPPTVDTSAVTAEEIIAGYRQMIARAHARGITIVGATLTPFMGGQGASEEGEATRQAVNAWIRESGEYDAVIDFDLATRDPADPGRMREDFHAGDWLHPNDAGYEAMAEAIDLSIFD